MTDEERHALIEYHLDRAGHYDRQAASGVAAARSHATYHRQEAAKLAQEPA